ncbi:glycoside hydrolase family 43 protein [Litorihabitans aurantiacus]|uniref:Xylosidase/arabinosidase n=1 Tax=Litorihabitans aurantiacus TaxID=1930061 RepID=A0AA37XFX8_9MICO|nr:glycoside hydrolase family 43 protein [Litorihabitans aurantiacus]GMA32475.1 xylosidase/arabinosidase [Litorihabitans aurantiacus]
MSNARAIDVRSVVVRPEAWEGATNPVLPGFHPDPSVCRVDHGPPGAPDVWFYLVSSTFEYLPGLPIHRSRDLVTWEHVGHAVTDQLEYAGVGDSGGLYAPTLRHDGARFLLVCTHLGGPEGASGNFAMTATDAAGPWSAPVWWHDSTGIDPSLLLDDDGRIWAHGARAAAEPRWEHQGEIWVREVDPGTLQLVGTEAVVFSTALVGGAWTEGPHLVRRDEHVVLVAAEGGTGEHHAIVTARATSPLGPFEVFLDNPALTHRHLGPGTAVTNVGHGDLVEAADGSWWAVCLASRMVDGVDLLGRETFLVPVAWVDGWPRFAPGVGTLVPEPGGPDGVARGEVGPPPRSPWIAVRRLPEVVADLTDPEAPRLRAGRGLDHAEPAFLGRRLLSPRSSLALEVPGGAAVDAGVAEVGLALRHSTRQWLTVGIRTAASDGEGAPHARHVVVTTCRDGELTTTSGPAVTGAGRLGITVAGRSARPTWTPRDGDAVGLGTVDVAHLATVHAGGFVGVVAGPYAIGDGDVTVGPLTLREVTG